jgi:hypothetical protein
MLVDLAGCWASDYEVRDRTLLVTVLDSRTDSSLCLDYSSLQRHKLKQLLAMPDCVLHARFQHKPLLFHNDGILVQRLVPLYDRPKLSITLADS